MEEEGGSPKNWNCQHGTLEIDHRLENKQPDKDGR